MDKDIQAYQRLLEERGYDEASLNNGLPPGTLATRLYTAFDQCRALAGENSEVRSFHIETTGFAPGSDAQVDFRFRFEFDPLRKTLNLKALVADTGNVKVLVVGKEPSRINESLPEAASLFASLAEYTAIREQKVAQQRKTGPGKGRRI